MKTSNVNLNALRTNPSFPREDQPMPAGEQAALSTRHGQPSLGRPPAKRRRLEPATHSHRHDDPGDRRGIAPERRPDRMPAYASTSSSSSQRLPQRPRHGVQVPADRRLTEQTSDRAAGKRPREQQEPYRQPKRPLHGVELKPAELHLAEHQLDAAQKKSYWQSERSISSS